MGLIDKAKKAAQSGANAAAGAAKDGANAAGNAVNQAGNAARSTAQEGVNAAGNAANQAANVVTTTVQQGTATAQSNASRTANSAKTGIQTVVKGFQRTAGTATVLETRTNQGAVSANEGAGKVIDIINEASQYKERLLNSEEERVAKQIFHSTLPYGHIAISNGLGKDRREYTSARPGKLLTYVLFMGSAGYDNGCTGTVKDINGRDIVEVFAHELTHVWQAYNGRVPPDTVFVEPQAWFDKTGSVYKYTAGKKWTEYNLEQQAEIVSHWWANGGHEDDNDNLWHYIRDNIRDKKL